MPHFSKGTTVFVIAVIIAGLLLVVFRASEEPQDAAENGGQATATPAGIPADIAAHIASKADLIVVDDPSPLAEIASPLTVSGTARGPWYFEATFSLILTNWDGEVIAQSYATAQDEWMTTEFVPFEGTIEFENPSFPGAEDGHFSRRGTLIFQKANASGLPEHDDALEIPVVFPQQ